VGSTPRTLADDLAQRQKFLAPRQIANFPRMATTAARRTYLDGDERRGQILRVAARLFSERSYDAVSTAEVAREAGVARGLVHHYFGAKRDLYLDVLRWVLRVPDDLFPVPAADGHDRDELLALAVDRWLRAVKRNQRTWLAGIGAQGFGRDPEVERVLGEAGEAIIDQLIALAWGPPSEAPPELRAIMRGYRGYAEAVTADWLQRNRPARRVVQAMLLESLLALVDDVLPRVAAARATSP
jgi:AcrR family transcriptional regulator